jgi:ParB family chromosome partitioning protein
MELEFHQVAMRYEGLRISIPGLQARIMASLVEEGQQHPVMVVKNETGTEDYVLIDGYRRVLALQALGRDTVEGVVMPLSESAALLFRHCQESSHPRSALEDGWLLRDLMELHGMRQADLSRCLQRSESWVSRRLSLVKDLPDSVQMLVRKGKLSGHAAMKYLVPLARAKRSDCEELSRNISGQRISTREMERVYVSWKGGDKAHRKRVVEKPLLFLKAAEELKKNPTPQTGNVLQAVLDDLEILDVVAGRARRRMRRIGTPVPETVIEVFSAAQSSFVALTEAMESWTNAGHGNQGSDSVPAG